MKLLFFFVLNFWGTATYCQNFAKAKTATDSTYGYSIYNPLLLKKGTNGQSLDYSLKFLGQLQTVTGQGLVQVKRISVKEPDYNPHKISVFNRRTASYLSRKRGLYDKYTFIAEGTKDSIVLFVDIYNNGRLLIPKGLQLKK
jgi:hypothetical protein